MNKYNKNITPYSDFYISKFTKNPDIPYLLFIHGGPGLNCGIIEYLIEHNNLFDFLNYNLLLYDQRNCGRSKPISDKVSHKDNVNDLQNIIQYLTSHLGIKVQGLIGHSYGAKILFDYYNQFHSVIPGIFVSTATSILTPRLNNLILDLAYLKKVNPSQYDEILQAMDNLNFEKIWLITEKLAPLFHENKDRLYLYWADLKHLEMIQKIQKKINLPMNTDTFISVRKDLYSRESHFSVAIDSLTIPNLWINGFHDFIMNGSEGMLSKNPKITTFFKSSHYPHLEENVRFSELINDFLKNL